jgi:hypothetical protein
VTETLLPQLTDARLGLRRYALLCELSIVYAIGEVPPGVTEVADTGVKAIAGSFASSGEDRTDPSASRYKAPAAIIQVAMDLLSWPGPPPREALFQPVHGLTVASTLQYAGYVAHGLQGG